LAEELCFLVLWIQNQLLLKEIEDLRRKEHDLQQENAELLHKVKKIILLLLLLLLPPPESQL
jgi:hypothetical protein